MGQKLINSINAASRLNLLLEVFSDNSLIEAPTSTISITMQITYF